MYDKYVEPALKFAASASHARYPQDVTRIVSEALQLAGVASWSEFSTDSKNTSSPYSSENTKPSSPKHDAALGVTPTINNPRDTISVSKPLSGRGAATFEQHQFKCRAGSRDYWLYQPNLQGGKPKGLIVMLHGCTQNARSFASSTGMNKFADKHQLVIAYPEQSRQHHGRKCWNWYSVEHQARFGGEPEILAGLTQQLVDQYGLVRDQTHLAGFSAGGAMASIMSESWPELFESVGIHSGLPFGSANDLQSAYVAMNGDSDVASVSQVDANNIVRRIIFHGQADQVVKPANGKQIADHFISSLAGVIDNPTISETNSPLLAKRVLKSSDGRCLLEEWQLKELGHHWPNRQANGENECVSNPNSSAEMIRFFLSSGIVNIG